MSVDAFDGKLAWFKENEKPEAVLLIADDQKLIRIAVAWTNTAVKRAEVAEAPGNLAEAELWDWLWGHARYSRDELLRKSTLSEHYFDQRMQTLVDKRVLYPDGTMNSYVQRYLRTRC
ncbi:MAG: hypothetical protein ACYTKD_14170 [Planctomycetota bacterium]|jgi:hypothetical protein